jgi:hypothetical protein
MFFNQNQPDNKPKHVRNLTNQLTQERSEKADIWTERPEESISFNPLYYLILSVIPDEYCLKHNTQRMCHSPKDYEKSLYPTLSGLESLEKSHN